MPIFHKPTLGVLGDMIPFYDEGRFKPFYLRNYRFWRNAQNQDSWVMLTTEDHVHFTEHDTKIVGGTGSVIKVDGLYHMFFCTFRRDPERNFINHATSKDLITWTEIEEDAFRSDDEIYAPIHWRDPFVFWNAEEKCWWMILAAQKSGPTTRQGCVGLCKSGDLKTWRYCEPLYAPMNAQCAFECPDLFHWGDWYYLVYSSYADRFQTLYRMSKDLNGPWLTPVVDTFDTRAFYAAKTCSDGSRRYIYGWNPTRECNQHGFDPQEYDGKDCNTWDWGGSLIVHELKQNADGTLRVIALDTLQNAVSNAAPLEIKPLSGSWQTGESSAATDATCRYASLLLGTVAQTCRLKMTAVIKEIPDSFGVAIQVDEGFDRGYYLMIEPHRGRVQYRTPVRMTERGGQMFPYEVEMERPLRVEQGERLEIELFVDETILEAYFGERVALGTRMYDLKDRSFGLFVNNGQVHFENIQLFHV